MQKQKKTGPFISFHYFYSLLLLFCLFPAHAEIEKAAWEIVEHEVTYNPTFLLSDDFVEKTDEDMNGVTFRLADIGYEDGVTFEGAETTHEIKLDFPIPSDTPVEDANIYLKYRISPLLNDLANLQLSVEDFPLQQVRLNTRGIDQVLLAEIPERYLQGGSVRLIIRAALPITEDRCLDTRVNGSNLHIDANSTFTVHYTNPIGSLRDAWTLLENKVILSIPDRAFEPAEFNAAWEMLDNLHRQGKQVEIAHFPTVGHIVIAKHAELEALLQQELTEKEDASANSFKLDPDIARSSMALVQTPVRSLIAILDPAQTNAFQLMNNPWRKLGTQTHYKTYPVDYADNLSGLGSIPAVDNALELRLTDLGADTSTRYVRSNLQWNMILDPFRIPPGTRPNRLFLNLIAPPPPNKPPFELYVYLNDIMVHATRLDSTEIQQQIAVPLPEKYQQPYNRIQLQIMNSDPQGDCRADLAAFPVQLMPDSSLIVERDLSLPKNFSDLPVYLADNFDFYLPSDYLQAPLQSLPFVSELTSRLPVPFKTRTASFLSPGDITIPDKPFVAIGDLTLDEVESPVRYDKGEIQVRDRNGSPLLKVDDLPEVTIAQIVTSNQQHGLWLRSSDLKAFPDVKELFLKDDDIAFADHSGLLFTMNSQQPTLATTYYPEARDWLALLGKYRFWIFVIGWLALTLIVLYLFRRAKQHREGQGNY